MITIKYVKQAREEKAANMLGSVFCLYKKMINRAERENFGQN